MGWIGVDLDGTLAKYTPGDGIHEVGEPVKIMLDRVKEWIAKGKTVKIVTARVSHPNLEFINLQVKLVQAWLVKHGLPPLSVICHKDFEMEVLWDDRCMPVLTNRGIIGIDWRERED